MLSTCADNLEPMGTSLQCPRQSPNHGSQFDHHHWAVQQCGCATMPTLIARVTWLDGASTTGQTTVTTPTTAAAASPKEFVPVVQCSLRLSLLSIDMRSLAPA
jgi:hypothetical protein